MHRAVTVILRGYREWTEGLGEDREWRIQLTQARIEETASKGAARCNSFYLPQRKDVLAFIANGVDRECMEEVVKEIEEVSPVPIETRFGCGPTPLSALRSDEWECESSPIAAVHVDLNYFTKDEVYSAYVRVMNSFSILLNAFLAVGGVGAYLGGDNFAFFLDPKDLGLVNEVERLVKDAKIGVGVGNNAREALAKAASSLRYLRENRNLRSYLIR